MPDICVEQQAVVSATDAPCHGETVRELIETELKDGIHISSLPPHGRVACSRCFDRAASWNTTQRQTPDGWHIVNNPMSWGAQTPRFLVLGVSKGTTQCEALNTKPHDQVPFDGFRPKLTDALRLLGLLSRLETIDDKIRDDETDWAFGSMVRCALGLVNPEDGRISRSGTVVQRLALMDDSQSWLTKCSSVFLTRLPAQLKVCVLLSNDDRYIEACRRIISRIRPMTRPINSVAYGDDQITWVHIVHVGGPGKNHINDWFTGNGTQGQKRMNAQNAVARALGRPTVATITANGVASPKIAETPKVKNGAAKRQATRGSGRHTPNNPTCDAVIAQICARDDVKPHRDQPRLHGTKYISAFATKGGTAFAIDKMSESKQPIWFLDNSLLQSALEQAAIAYDLYPPERGRNSNLHKLPGFKGGSLIRAYPKTVEEALHIVDLLCHSLKPEPN